MRTIRGYYPPTCGRYIVVMPDVLRSYSLLHTLSIFNLRWNSSYSQKKVGRDMRSCQDIHELTQLTYRKLDTLTPRDFAEFWSGLPKVLHKTSRQNDPDLEKKLASILDCTLENLNSFNSININRTAWGIAKVINILAKSKRRHRKK